MEEIKIALQSLRMSGMGAHWQTLFETRQVDKLSLADGLQLLIQAERDTRTCNRVNRLLKNAAFPHPALLEEMDADSSRGIDPSVLTTLSSCDFKRDGRSVIITGATGTGKSYLATALGDRACRLGMTVAYYNMQRLLDRLDDERVQGHAIRFLDRLAKTDLLILDDFGMKRLQGQQQNDFEQLVDDRYRKKGLIISSQLPIKDWSDVIGNELIAEAFLDRLVHKSIRIELKGESLRKKY
ncbi:MAG: IS21-like element helper ATPase IstB [Muribaculaceae bacterium]|nr:IS21-like element helper ATPase IstB [Muribaculaceae bacterium]